MYSYKVRVGTLKINRSEQRFVEGTILSQHREYSG